MNQYIFRNLSFLLLIHGTVSLGSLHPRDGLLKTLGGFENSCFGSQQLKSSACGTAITANHGSWLRIDPIKAYMIGRIRTCGVFWVTVGVPISLINCHRATAIREQDRELREITVLQHENDGTVGARWRVWARGVLIVSCYYELSANASLKRVHREALALTRAF